MYDRAFRPGPGRALGFWAKPGPGRAYQKPGPGTGPEKSLNFSGEMVKISKIFNEFLKLEFIAYNLDEENTNWKFLGEFRKISKIWKIFYNFPK